MRGSHYCLYTPCRRCQFDYDRAQVEKLLVSHFNGGIVDDEVVVDPTMPRAKNNPARQGSGMAHSIDIANAWKRADLTRTARIGIFLHFGNGYSYTEAGTAAGVTKQSMGEAIDKAVGVITATINGKKYKEEEAEEVDDRQQ